MVDVTPGDSGANKGFWREQLRDRFGKFVKMGGSVIFTYNFPNIPVPSRANGTFIGMADPETARIEVKDDSQVPRGVYLVKREDIEAVNEVARIPSADTVAPKLQEADTADLKEKISGDEALKTRMKSIARALKDEGRFPIPRQGALSEVGKNTDVAKGARIDYKKVFDADPEVQERFKTFENMWDYVAKAGTDLTTQSPNDLSEIPEDMKMLNQAYAKHVLGVKPDGLLTVYRNAVNGKDSESESAVGYVSLDRQMAWDYNSTRENIGANGRYEIDVKPDEVYGMIGYSQIEDEYGLTIGRGVTEQEGRVRRVGDLEPAELPYWLEDWNNSFRRQRGESPLRGYGIAGEYDFHEVEDFGENVQEFFEKYGIQASDIAEMFDKLYGEGSYARYKESGNPVSFQLLKKMFIKLENGNLGLNAEYLDSFATLKQNSEYKDDQFDNILKMLSVFQELTGQHFMTHKTRDYTPPLREGDQPSVEKQTVEKPQVGTEYEEADHYELPALEPQTVDETLALSYYTGETNKYVDGHKKMNTYLRSNQHYEGVDTAREQELILKNIEFLKKLVNSQVIDKNIKVFRYQEELPEGLQVGDVWTSDGFLSTSTATTQRGDQIVETEFAKLPVKIEVYVPAGSRGGAVDTYLGRDEGEVLLPPGSRFIIQSIEDIDSEKKLVKILLVGQDE